MNFGVLAKGEWHGEWPNGRQVVLRWMLDQTTTMGKVVSISEWDLTDADHPRQKRSSVMVPLTVFQQIVTAFAPFAESEQES